jgi:hypothetical protein
VDHAGLITPMGLAPMHVHDLPLCRRLFETASVLRAGDWFWEDRGLVDGDTITFLKPPRHVEVMVPLQSTLVSSKEAVQRAALHDAWAPHPSRDQQHMAFVHGVDHLWEACQVPLHACVMRYGNRQKAAWDSLVLVTTDPRLNGPWRVRHYEERPEIGHDDAQRKRGGWQLQKLRATRDSEMVFSSATVVLSYSLYHLFSNPQAGARCADQTRQALAFEQLRSRRTPIIVYAGGYFESFETLSFVRFVLQLPASVQDRLRRWLDEHLHTVQQRE